MTSDVDLRSSDELAVHDPIAAERLGTIELPARIGFSRSTSE